METATIATSNNIIINTTIMDASLKLPGEPVTKQTEYGCCFNNDCLVVS